MSKDIEVFYLFEIMHYLGVASDKTNMDCERNLRKKFYVTRKRWRINMLEKIDGKPIKKICLASASLFALSAYTEGWFVALGAALGYAADLIDENGYHMSCAEELHNAIFKAVELAKSRSLSQSQIRVLDELVTEQVQPENIGQLIEKSEAFQTQYCTIQDKKEIIDLFEACFREIVPEYPKLCRLYIQSTGIASLEQLKEISKIMFENTESIASIRHETNKISAHTSVIAKSVKEIEQFIALCTREIAFSFVSMAIFLLLGIFAINKYNEIWTPYAVASYIISSFVMCYLEKSIHLLSFNKELKDVKMLDFSRTVFIEPVTYSLISIALFLMLVMQATNNQVNLDVAVFCFLGGGYVGQIMKNILREKA